MEKSAVFPAQLQGKTNYGNDVCTIGTYWIFFLFFFICMFYQVLVFRIAVLPHRPGVVYYHLLLRRETRIPGVAPFSF